jgi:elongation factor 1-beta
MARLVARIKVLPTDVDINFDAIVSKMKESMPEGMELKNTAKEPIAFGLNALILDFMLDDSEGQMEMLENMVKQTEGVSEIEVMNISRQASFG